MCIYRRGLLMARVLISEKVHVLIPSREAFKALEAELRLGRTCGRSPLTENNG